MFISDSNAVEFGGHLETPAEREFYNYVRDLAQQPSAKAIEAYYRLLLKGDASPNQSVRSALEKILDSPKLPQVGNFVINRCFHTVGNRWMQEKGRQGALYELVMGLSAELSAVAATTDPYVKRLHGILQDYLNSELYEILKWQMRLRAPEQGPATASITENTVAERPLRDEFERLFFIHEAMTTTPDIPVLQRRGIRQVQAKQAYDFNNRLRTFADRGDTAAALIKNPTVFSDPEATRLVQTYRPDRSHSLHAIATEFQGEMRGLKLGDVREELQRFVLEPLAEVDSRLSPAKQGWIQNELRSRLTYGEADSVGFNPVSVMTLCKRLLKFLVVESASRPSSPYFKKLIKRVGHCAFTQALLRIALFWPQIRFFVGERFSILFKFYKDVPKEDEKVAWLSQSLEHLNMGLALNGHHLHYFNAP